MKNTVHSAELQTDLQSEVIDPSLCLLTRLKVLWRRSRLKIRCWQVLCNILNISKSKSSLSSEKFPWFPKLHEKKKNKYKKLVMDLINLQLLLPFGLCLLCTTFLTTVVLKYCSSCVVKCDSLCLIQGQDLGNTSIVVRGTYSFKRQQQLFLFDWRVSEITRGWRTCHMFLWSASWKVLFQTLNATKLENLEMLTMSDNHRALVRVFCGDPMKTGLAEKWVCSTVGPQPCEKLIQCSDPARKDGASLIPYLVCLSCCVFGVVESMLFSLWHCCQFLRFVQFCTSQMCLLWFPVFPGTLSNSYAFSVFDQTQTEPDNSQFDHTPARTQKSRRVQNWL